MNVREQFETNKKFLEYERDEQAFLLFVFVFVVREPYLLIKLIYYLLIKDCALLVLRFLRVLKCGSADIAWGMN